MKIKTKKAVLITLALALTLSLGFGISNFSKPVSEVKAATAITATQTSKLLKNGVSAYSLDGKTAKWDFSLITTGAAQKYAGPSVDEGGIIFDGGSNIQVASSGGVSCKGSSSIYIPATGSGTITMTTWSTSDTRYFDLYVNGTAVEGKRLWSKYNATVTDDGKRGPQSFDYEEKDLTTIDLTVGGETTTGTYLWLKDNNAEMKVSSFTVENAGPSKYTVTYNTNGGSEVSNANVAEGESITLAEAPTKSGYDFVEWNTVSDGSGEGFSPGESFTPQSNTVFYAIWSAKAYAISFDLDGETAENLPDTATCGSTVTLPTLSRDGYNLSWSVKTASGEVITVSDNSFVMPDSDVTVTAIFEEQKNTVTYNTNGGSAVSSITVKIGESITLAEAPTKSGYDFVEWNTTSDGSGEGFAPGDSFTPQSNTVFYAIWSAKAYAISFDLDGETAENLPDKATCGSTVTLPTLSRDGYNLSWSVKTASGEVITVSDNSFVMPDSDVTVTAIFEEQGLVTVIFMDGDAEYTRVKTRVGAYVERPQDPPLKSNSLRFGGWYTDNTKSSHGNKFDFDEDKITGETTLYSLWIDPVDTVSFKNYIDSLIDKTASNIKGQPAWATEGFKKQFNYIDGVFLNGVVNLYYATYDTKYKDFFLDFVTNYVNSDGDLVNVTTGNKITLLKELDFVCESKILFDAYELSLDEKYIKAIEKNYANLLSMGIVKNTNDNYEHKSKYSQQIWLDGMYMYAPFNARYLSATGKDVSEFHKLRMQYQFIADNMKDELTGLYYHAYSQNTSLQWVDPTNYCSHNFWLRSVGWLTMSLVDVIEYFPGGEDRDALIDMFQGLVDSLLQFKDEDTSMYYQIVNYDSYIDANNRNYLEVSGSSMIAYSLLKGGRLGYLKSDVIDYRAEGEKAFEGIYSHSLDSSTNKLYDICKQAGLDGSGSRNGTIEYYLSEPVSSNEGKGVGPFILAFIEYTNKQPDAPITPDIRQKTVTFDVDGETTSYLSYTCKTVTRPSDPSVEGKTFSHWSTKPCGVTFDFSATVEDDMTLYAVWQEESLAFDYSVGDTFKAASEIMATEKLSDYAFVGWIMQNDASKIYNAGDTVVKAGSYTALFAKASFIGGSLRKTGKTGVRLGFDVEILNITDSQLLTDIANDISAVFTIRTSKDNVFNAKSYKIENGRLVLFAVITNDIDATKSEADVNKCKTTLTASISVTFATSNVTVTASYGNFSIQDIATLALNYNYIDTAFAKKYGYGA